MTITPTRIIPATYRAFDGKDFDNEDDCLTHEESLRLPVPQITGKTIECAYFEEGTLVLKTTTGEVVNIEYNDYDGIIIS